MTSLGFLIKFQIKYGPALPLASPPAFRYTFMRRGLRGGVIPNCLKEVSDFSSQSTIQTGLIMHVEVGNEIVPGFPPGFSSCPDLSHFAYFTF